MQSAQSNDSSVRLSVILSVRPSVRHIHVSYNIFTSPPVSVILIFSCRI